MWSSVGIGVCAWVSGRCCLGDRWFSGTGYKGLGALMFFARRM
jgi:hypothetical protein